MRFDTSFLENLKDRVPISDIIGKRVAWDKRKTNVARGDWWACCPFHGEKTPSFHCEDRKGRYHCFGCNASGDHFRFLTELDGLSFVEAVQHVADLAGVPMPAPDPRAAEREKERASLIDVMEMATGFFQQQLQSSEGAKARAYLRDRGLSGRTIEAFRLGYAPDGGNPLKAFLASKEIEKQQIEACGLVVHGPDIAVSYDRFRDRIMFPIHNAREKVIAFGGRAMSPDIPAKYINSNETELFHKGRVLFNFARARRAGQPAGGSATVIAVEGYMDVIGLFQAGIENAVAPLGTALTEEQLSLLWRMASEPVLCFDGDDAGRRAAYRAADLALGGLKPGRSLRFAMLPAGKDPDDLVREGGREAFDQAVARAQPLADLLWMRETSGGVFDTPEKRAALEAGFRRITGGIGDESVRRHYAQEMRERLNAYFEQGAGPRVRGGGDRWRPGERRAGRRYAMSSQLARSALVRGANDLPRLRESVLALTLVNHPEFMISEFDEVSAIEFDHPQLIGLLERLLDLVADAQEMERVAVRESLDRAGFGAVIERIEQQIRNTREWTATQEAAPEDAREAFGQVVALYKRSQALALQKRELERDLAEATETGDDAAVPQLLQALQTVQTEVSRLEHQHALVEGFGVLSGRVRGAAGK